MAKTTEEYNAVGRAYAAKTEPDLSEIEPIVKITPKQEYLNMSSPMLQQKLNEVIKELDKIESSLLFTPNKRVADLYDQMEQMAGALKHIYEKESNKRRAIGRLVKQEPLNPEIINLGSDAVGRRIDDLSKQIKDLEARASSLGAQSITIVGGNEDTRGGLITESEKLKNTLEEYQRVYDAFDKQISGLEAEVSEIETSMIQKEAALSQANKTIEELGQKIIEKENTDKNFPADLRDGSTQPLRDQKGAVETHRDELQSEIAQQQQSIDKIKKQIEDIKKGNLSTHGGIDASDRNVQNRSGNEER